MRTLKTFKTIIALIALFSSTLLFTSCATSTMNGKSQNNLQPTEDGYGGHSAGGHGGGGHGGGH